MPEMGQLVEVLGFDGEPKYVGTFAGTDADQPGRYCIWNEDTQEFHYPPKDNVREVTEQ